MAETFYTDIDLNGNELQNFVVQVLASDPGTPLEGQMWYNSTDNVLRYYDGTDVIDLDADVTLDFGESGDIGTLTFGAAGSAGATGEVADAGHVHPMPANPVTAHEANAADIHPQYQKESEKGNANGYASLDGAGRVPASQLPVSAMEYQGTWNATTNSPALVDGTGSAGDLYRVSTAGTQNLGSGAITFDVGDYVIYNGTTWEKGDTTDAVSSVFSRTGAVTAQVGDYAAFYSRFYADDIGDGATTPIVVTHGLGTRRVKVEVYRNSTPWDTVVCGVARNSTSQVTLDFNGYVPTNDEFTVLVTAAA